MGLLDGLIGHGSNVDPAALQAELASVLVEGEQVELAFKIIRDMFIFTNRRLLLIDKQGITGKKVSYHSIPYRAVTQFSVETAGSFDLDSELKLWLTGHAEPMAWELKKGTDVVGLQRALAQFVCR